MAKICLAADTIYSSAVLCFSTQGRADGHLLLVKYWVGLSTSYEPKSKTRAIPLSGRFCQKLVSRSFSRDPWSAWWNEAVVSEPYLPWVKLNDRPKFWQHVFRQFSSLFLPSFLSVFVFVSSFPPVKWCGRGCFPTSVTDTSIHLSDDHPLSLSASSPLSIHHSIHHWETRVEKLFCTLLSTVLLWTKALLLLLEILLAALH